MVLKLNIEGISCLVSDSGCKFAFVFIHGFPDTKEVWSPIVARLPEYFSWVTLDLPSFGESLLVDDSEMKLESIVERLSSTILSLPFQNLVLVGHDWGGILAWLLLDTLESRVQKLTLINGPHPHKYHELINSSIEQGKIAQYATAFCRENAAEKLLTNRMKTLKLFHPFPSDDDSYSEKLFHQKWDDLQRLHRSLGIYRSNLEDIIAGKVRDPYSLVPVCTIWGVDDHALVSDNYQQMRSKCKSKFECHTLKGGHWVFLEESQKVAEILTKELPSRLRN